MHFEVVEELDDGGVLANVHITKEEISLIINSFVVRALADLILADDETLKKVREKYEQNGSGKNKRT